MNKKQKLRNAVILGLLMSSVTASSAWAASLNVENIKKAHEQLQHTFFNRTTVTGIAGGSFFDRYPGPAQGFQEFEQYECSEENPYDYIDINVKNNYYYRTLDPENIKGDEVVGILTTSSEDVNLISKGNVDLNVQTRNSRNGFGIHSNNNDKNVNLVSQTGNINIDVTKTNGEKNKLEVAAPNPDDIDYSTANIYGIYTENNGTANLTAGTDIIITAGYDKTAAEEYTSLKQGDIYGISNTGGIVNLIADNIISITANSANGNAYGIYTDSNKDTKLNGNVNITAVADGTGTAIGIKAENGSKVDIIGDTSVSGDNGAIVISGKDSAAVPLNGEYDFQVTVDGNLTAEAAEGAAITVEKNGSLHVKDNQFINNTFEIKENSNVVIDGSLAGIGTIAENAVNVSGSRLTVGGNVSLDSEKIGMNITENSNVTIER